MPKWSKKYCEHEQEDEGFIQKAIVALDELYCVLYAWGFDEIAGLFAAESANDLYAVQSAVFHLLYAYLTPQP